ncbi:hypothetical protein, partial [Bacteroides sp. OF04-15BH]|uniref:hypothetical protein n=1 Tax=Bacteroides sp. OF04-15BH TaxID=2292281 RepID=UPI000FF11D93
RYFFLSHQIFSKEIFKEKSRKGLKNGFTPLIILMKIRLLKLKIKPTKKMNKNSILFQNGSFSLL